MPYDSSGNFANVSGASSATAGQIVQSAVWNNIHEDYSDALNMLMNQMIRQRMFRNALCANGGFEVWQRGTSVSVAAGTTAYTVDRWYITTGANQASTIAQATGMTDNSQFCARVQRDNGQTGTGTVTFGFPLETEEVIRLRNNKVEVRCVVQTGASWSPSSIALAFYTGTGSEGKRGGGFTGETAIISTSVTLGAGATETSISAASSVVVPTNATQAELQFTWTPSGTAGATDYVEIDDVQLEPILTVTATWTQNVYEVIPFDVQLELCKRHYQKTFNYSVAPAQNVTVVGALQVFPQVDAVRTGASWLLPHELRTVPSITFYCPLAASANWISVSTTGGANASVGAATDPAGNIGTKVVGVLASGASISAGRSLLIHIEASAGL